MADIPLKENSIFDKRITKDDPGTAIVALPRDNIPQGITLNTDTGQVSGIPRNIPDAGSTFRVAYAQITGGRTYKTTEHRFVIGTSRPPVWNKQMQYFWVTASISIDLSTYVTGRSTITFTVIGSLPSWLTLTGTMMAGTNPQTGMTTVRIYATNEDGRTERHFIFARATDPRPIYGQAVYGVSKYPFNRALPLVFSSELPLWDNYADYFFNDVNISVDLYSGYIINPTVAIFSIVGELPSWLSFENSILSGTNPRTELVSVRVRATNESGSVDKRFYFGRATDNAPQYGRAQYGTAYYL